MSAGDGPIHVLHVDDEPDFADLAATFLERADDRLDVRTATGPDAGLEILADTDVDCIVSDYDMPGTNGIEFLETVREEYPTLPFILYTGKGSEEVASDAISAGVTDYLQKETGASQYEVLANRVTNAVEQARAQRAVAETERTLSEIADKTDDILFMFDADWSELLFVNAAYEEVWGGSIAELEADPSSFLDRIHPEDRPRARRSMERLSAGDVDEMEYRVRAENGDLRWVRGESKPIVEDGEVARIVGFVRDITDRKRRERELRRRERRYQAVFNDPNILVALLDTDGTVLEVNETALSYVDAPRDAVTGAAFPETPWFDHSEAIQRSVREWVDRAAAGEYVEFDATLERSDDEAYTVEGVFRPVTDEDGDVVSILVSDRDVTERTERERELQRYEAYLEESTDIITVLDETGRIKYQSPAVTRILGYEQDALIGVDAFEFVHPEDVERVRSAFADLVGDPGAATTVQCRFRTAAGDFRWLEIRGTNQLHNPGIEGIVTNNRDITERKRQERELRRTKRAIDEAPVGVTISDPSQEDNPLIYANDSFLSLTGYDEAAVLGRNCRFLQGPDTDPEAVAEMRAAIADERRVTVDLRNYRKDGTAFWNRVSIAPVRDDDGTVVNYVGFQEDITDHRRRERVLRSMHDIIADREESFEDQVQALLELGRAELDTDYGTLSAIRGADYEFEVVASDDDTVQAGDVVPLAATNCEVAASEQETLVLGDVARDAPEETDRAGYTDWGIACYLGAPVFLDDEVYGTFCFYGTEPRAGQFTDWEVTLVDLMSRWVSSELQRRRTNDRLTEKNEQLEQFASIVSHDLRNPLNVAEGRLELLREDHDSEHVDALARALDRMDALITDLLTLAREGEAVSDRTAVDLDALTTACWRTVDTAAATLQTTVDRELLADEGRLRQLFENLFRNSVEHGGPDVTVTVGELEDGFFVADDGPGVPEADRESVFDAGYSTADGGTGFGLSIVDQVVQAHGWDLHLCASADGGARFEITGVEFVEE